jgi:HK97 family phage major capsid protein
MFEYKTLKELSELSIEDQQKYQAEKAEHEATLRKNELTQAIEDAQKNNASKEDVEKLQNTLKAVTDELEKAMMQLKSIAEVPQVNIESVGEQMNKFISENIDKIKTIKSEGKGFVELEIKAVADVTTANGTNTSPPSITGVQQAPLSNVNLRTFNVLPFTTNLPTSLSAYPYTEATPKDGDYTFVAEGGTKPQIDLQWETNYAKPVKTAAWIRLTEEAVQDVVNLQSVANDYLRRKHDLKKTRGILFGDGIAPNPKGATTYGRVFSAGALATSVVNPNIMDVINACITDIYTTHNFTDEESYMANLVMMNPVDFFINFVSAKDANGIPLYPTATLFNQVTIGGVSIIPDEMIPTGKIFVSDMSKYNTTNYLSYTVKIGWINDDFIKNQFVILGESRFHAFVKKLDEQAFIYDDIATIKTAITAP